MEYINYIVPKGFIAVDGTSLTICEVNNERSYFTIMLVPHTQQHVVLPNKNIGDDVNIEVDILAKLIENRISNKVDDNKELDELRNKVGSLEKEVAELKRILESKL